MRRWWVIVAQSAAVGICAAASHPATCMVGQAIAPHTRSGSGGSVVPYFLRQVPSKPSKEASKMSTSAESDPDVGSKQALADTFRNLVRYALLKTRRDVVKLGVTPSSFSVEAIDSSLAARANGGIFGAQTAPSLKRLLNKAREPSLTFHMYWMAPTAPEPLEAAFALSYEPDGDLQVRLLWLGLPERIPIARGAGVVGGLKPLDEAVTELLRVLKDGRLAPYPPPE